MSGRSLVRAARPRVWWSSRGSGYLKRFFEVALALADRWSWALALAGSVIATFAIYGQALDFAFFFDDTFDLTRVEGRSYLSLLTSSEGYSYYRPIPFLIWKVIRDLTGYYPAPLLHLLPLLAHALCGWLLFLLLRKLGVGYWALVPVVLFLTYPFSYQDVMIVGVVFHPLAAMWMLASTVLYLKMREEEAGNRVCVYGLLAGLATALALWTHESGVVVAVFLLGVEAILMLRGKPGPSRWLLLHGGLIALFGLAYLTVERQPVAEQVTLSGLHPKLLFFMQGLSYPIAAQINWIDDQIGFAPGLLESFVLTLLLVLILPGVLLWKRWASLRGLLNGMSAQLLGLAVAAAVSVPAIARLSWPYVEDAPRLLYLVGFGAAILWGLLPAIRFQSRGLTLVWRGAWLSLIALIVIQSLVFISVRLDMFASATSAMNGVTQAGERYPEHLIIVVNMPAWLAQDEYEYPYGHLGAQVVPSYIGLERAIYTSSNRQVEVGVWSIQSNPEVADGSFTFGPHAPEDFSHPAFAPDVPRPHVFEVVRDGDGFQVVEVGQRVPGGADGVQAGAVRLGDDLSMSTPRLSTTSDSVMVYLSWLVNAPLSDDFTVEVRAVDESGAVVRQRTARPLAGTSQPAQWEAGDRIDDGYWLGGLPDGVYSIEIGRRSASSGQLLPPGYIVVGAVEVRTNGR